MGSEKLCTDCGEETCALKGGIYLAGSCFKAKTEATETPSPISSTEFSGYTKCYDKYNSELCSAIDTITELETTQRPITSEEYNGMKITLEAMRDILFSLKS